MAHDGSTERRRGQSARFFSKVRRAVKVDGVATVPRQTLGAEVSDDPVVSFTKSGSV